MKIDVTAEVKRMIWESAAEYHERLVLRCVGMAEVDPMVAAAAALAIEVHVAMAAYARAEIAKLTPPMQGEEVKP